MVVNSGSDKRFIQLSLGIGIRNLLGMRLVLKALVILIELAYTLMHYWGVGFCRLDFLYKLIIL